MAATSFFRKSVLATLAAATAISAIPATALAAPGDRQGHEERGGQPAWAGGQRGWNGGGQQQQQQQRPVFQPRAETGADVRAQGGRPDFQRPTPWQGRGHADNAPRWGQQAGAQRPADQVRDWNNGRATRQPAQTAGQPAWRSPGNVSHNDRADGDRPRNDRGQFPGWRNDNGDRNPDQAWNRDQPWNRDRDNHRDGDRWRNDSWRSDSWRGNDWRQNHNGYADRGDWRDNNYRRWDNDWRRDNRYNWYGWRNQHRDVFRGGYYYAPYRGYSYSRLSIGFFLGSPFYAERYWITDPWAYRLPPAYGPYRWVRYYDDVLLVDTFSGEVVDVIHDFFW